jgi:phage major head subunit gpT-like protein
VYCGGYEWKGRNKMKIFKKIEITNPEELRFTSVQEIDRTERGLEYFRKNAFARRDVLLCQVYDVANVFVEPDGSVDVQFWYGIDGDKEVKEFLIYQAKEEYKNRKYFIEKQIKFFDQV